MDRAHELPTAKVGTPVSTTDAEGSTGAALAMCHAYRRGEPSRGLEVAQTLAQERLRVGVDVALPFRVVIAA